MSLRLALLCWVPSLLAACTYAPNFDNSTLACGENMSCPKGYSCANDGTCWKEGTSPASDDPLEKFAGKWGFDTGSLESDCSSSPAMTASLVGDYMVVVELGTSLIASYYCDWTLHRQPGTTKATLDPGQSCPQVVHNDQTNVDVTYTWSGRSFVFTTTDGNTATLEGHIAGPYVGSDGTNGTCDGTFSGQLTKVPQ